VKADYRLYESDVLRVGRTDKPWTKATLTPLDIYGIGFEVREGDEILGYELVGFKRYLFPQGSLQLPFAVPDVRFELPEKAGQSLTLPEVLTWIYARS